MRGTKSDILERVTQLVATHAKVPSSQLRDNVNVWELFPVSRGRYENPAVTEFVRAVHREFDVFLTEEEWESPSVATLALLVARKVDDPRISAADRASERGAERKGALMTFAFMGAIGVMSYFLAEGSERRRFSIAVGLTLFSWAMLALIYFAEARRRA